MAQLNCNPLAGCRAKLARAKDHIDCVESEIATLVRGGTYSVVGENQPDKQRYLFRVDGPPLPLRLAVVAGEVVHHLRSSLDHIVWALASNGGTAPDRQIMFPVCDTKKKFDDAVKRGALRGVDKEACLIIEAMQPFRLDDPEASVLKIVHDLNIQDKHRLLVVTTTAMRFGPNIVVDGGDADVTLHLPPAASGSPFFRGDENGKEVQWISYTSTSDKVKVKNDFTVHVVLEKIGAVERLELIPSLRQLHAGIDTVTSEFDQFFGR